MYARRKLITGGVCAALLMLVVAACSGCFAVRRQCRLPHEDGTYRGIFADGDSIQVNVEFTLEDGKITKASYRHLRRDDDYFLGAGDEPYKSVVRQYMEALDYLVGKDLEKHLPGLYSPEEIVATEVDGYTSATIRSSKIISAVRDGLNRGVYSY